MNVKMNAIAHDKLELASNRKADSKAEKPRQFAS